MIARKIVKQFPLGCGIRISFSKAKTKVRFEAKRTFHNEWMLLADARAGEMLDYYPMNVDTIMNWYTKYRAIK